MYDDYDYYEEAYEEAASAGMYYFVIVLLIHLIIIVFLTITMSKVAEKKGYDDSTPEKNAHPTAMCLLFGIFGAIYIVALPDLVLREKVDKLLCGKDDEKKLPVTPKHNDELPEL